MPGNGTRQRMWMRFRTQFYSQQDYAWKYVDERRPVAVGGGRIGDVRCSRRRATSSSSTRRAPGTTFLLRGVVEFQWRSKGGKVVRRTRKFTEAGHRTRGADPPGSRRRGCRIEGPAPGATPKLVEP